MTEQTIPAELAAALGRSGLASPELLSVNERKGRFCLRAERDGRDWFVKWNSPESPEHSRLLQKEKKIYEALDGSGIVPELLRADDDLLVLRFLDGGRTLRSRLLAGDGAEEAVRSAIDAYAIFLDTMRRNGRALKDLCTAVNGTAQFDRHLWQLFQSGPQDTKVDKLLRKVNQLPLAGARRQNRIGARLRRGAAGIAAPEASARGQGAAGIAAPEASARGQGAASIAAPEVSARGQGAAGLAAPEASARGQDAAGIAAPEVSARGQGGAGIAAPEASARGQGAAGAAAPEASARGQGAASRPAAPRRALLHGDLHLNNFLLGDAVTLLDFEDAAFGYVEVELAYFLAQTEALVDDPRLFDGLRDAALRRLDGLQTDLFEEAFAWYRAAIAYNPRFLKTGRPLPLPERSRRWKLAAECGIL